MDERHGWLERSLERARENIEARPEHLKPNRYRRKKSETKVAVKRQQGKRRAA